MTIEQKYDVEKLINQLTYWETWHNGIVTQSELNAMLDECMTDNGD